MVYVFLLEKHFCVKYIQDSKSTLCCISKVNDSSGSIVRRYACTDKVAVTYAVRIEFGSLKGLNTVTLRERDSMELVIHIFKQ